MGRGKGGIGRGKVQGRRSIISRHKIGRDKNVIGNRGLKELTCTSHGHELRRGMSESLGWGTGQRGR